MATLENLYIENKQFVLSGKNSNQVVLSSLCLDDGSLISEWDHAKSGAWGQHYDDEGNSVWNPEPAYPDDEDLIALIASHLGVDSERVKLGEWDGCDGRLDQAIATVRVEP